MSMSRVARLAAVALLVTLVPILAPQIAGAATACSVAHKTWAGPSGGNWSDPLNWAPEGVPVASDHVCIESTAVVVDLDVTVASIEASALVTVPDAVTLSLGGTAESAIEDAVVEGTLAVSGPFLVEDSLQINDGVIEGAGTLTVAPSATVTASGAGVTVVGVIVTNNGTFVVGAAALQLLQPFTNQGSLTFDGSAPQMVTIAPPVLLTNNGVLSTGDHNVSITGVLIDLPGAQLGVGSGGLVADGLVVTHGVVTIAGGDLAVPALTVTSGASLELLDVNSSLSIAGGTGQLVVEYGGTVKGAGSINGDLRNFGEINVAIGDDVGWLSVSGNYVAEPDSLLVLPLEGVTADEQYARLLVAGSLTAGGTVHVPTSGFLPAVNDAMRIVEAASTTSAFTAVNSDLAGAVVLSSQLDATGLVVVAVNNTGSISGTVYDDRNGNGIRNTDEPGLVGRTVFVDADADDVHDDGEMAATTDANGDYVLNSVIAGAVAVETSLPEDWVITSAPVTAEVAAGETVVSKDFGEFQKSDVAGSVFIDTNGDSVQDPVEPVSGNRTVFIDTNGNGVRNVDEPSTTTDFAGHYSFADVGPGTYRVRAVQTGGYVLSTSLRSITALSGSDATVNFGLYLFSSISGTVFSDANRDGVRDTAEPGLAGRGIYVDKNGNGVFDGTDVSTTTSSSGSYSFSGLIGTQQVRLVLTGDETQTPQMPVLVGLTSGAKTAGVNIGVAVPQVDVLPDVIERSDPVSDGTGYWMVAADGGVFSYGDAQFYGSMGGKSLNAPIVGMAPSVTGEGYWQVASDGGVFSYGDAQFYGSMGGKLLNAPMVGIAGTGTLGGYWTVASDGGVFSYGDAQFYGSMGGKSLNAPIVGIVPTATGEGYWQIASDGGVFSYGDAEFYGSAEPHRGSHVVVGMARSGVDGYWIVDADGGVYSFGSAQFHGSMGGHKLNSPIVSIRSTEDGDGYWLFAADGGVFAFGSAQFFGGTPLLNSPIVE